MNNRVSFESDLVRFRLLIARFIEEIDFLCVCKGLLDVIIISATDTFSEWLWHDALKGRRRIGVKQELVIDEV